MDKPRYRAKKFENEGYAKKTLGYACANLKRKNKISHKQANLYRQRKQELIEGSYEINDMEK